jgi:integrase/recombinase XerC
MFAASEHRRGQSPRSIQRRLSVVRTFFHFLNREGVCGANPALDVQAPKAGRRLPDTVDADQMSRLLDAHVDGSLDQRDKAMVELFYSSGLRLAELVGLDLLDLDMADRTVRVLGKGRKERIVPVGRQALAALQAWLKIRGEFAPIDELALFVSRDGRRLSPRAVQSRVKRWAQMQGTGVHLHPHLFRHSFASHLLESSQDLRGVQELLGRANLGTTQIYTHLDFQHLAKIYDAAHPRAKRRR